MKQQWYCGVGNEQYGPFTWDQMRAMVAEGRIVAESLVRRDIDERWFRASQVAGLVPKPAEKAPTRGGSSIHAAGAAKPSPAGSRLSNHAAAAESKPGQAPPKLKKARPLDQPAASQSQDKTPVGTAVGGGGGSRSEPRRAGVASLHTQPPSSEPSPESPPVIVAAPPASASGGHPVAPPQRGNKILLIVGVAAGVLLLVGAGSASLVVWGLMRAKSALEAEVQAALEQAGAELIAFEGDAAALTAALDEPAAIGGQDSSTATAAELKEAASLVASQAAWLNIARINAINIGGFRLQIAGVWLASDATGTRATVTLVTASGAAPSALASDARYVFVELQITNTAPVPRRYQGWNTARPRSVALADQQNRLLPLVPPDQTPGVARLASFELSPGQSATDMLVFAAPQEGIELLHLLLEKKLLSDGAPGHFALEIPLETLLDQRPVARRDAAAPPPAAAASRAAADDAPQAAARPSPAPAGRAGVPPSIEDLDRQIQGLLDKQQGAAAPADDGANADGDGTD